MLEKKRIISVSYKVVHKQKGCASPNRALKHTWAGRALGVFSRTGRDCLFPHPLVFDIPIFLSWLD